MNLGKDLLLLVCLLELGALAVAGFESDSAIPRMPGLQCRGLSTSSGVEGGEDGGARVLKPPAATCNGQRNMRPNFLGVPTPNREEHGERGSAERDAVAATTCSGLHSNCSGSTEPLGFGGILIPTS